MNPAKATAVLRVLEKYGYIGIASIVALESLFPPLPSEVILPFAGFLTRRGTLSVSGVIIASIIGSLVGAFILYGAGRILGRERLYQMAGRRFPLLCEAGLRKAGHWFAKYGPWTVFLCRMVSPRCAA